MIGITLESTLPYIFFSTYCDDYEPMERLDVGDAYVVVSNRAEHRFNATKASFVAQPGNSTRVKFTINRGLPPCFSSNTIIFRINVNLASFQMMVKSSMD